MNKDLIDALVNSIFCGIPECIALTMLMLAFLQLPLIWKKVLIVGITQTITVLIFRLASDTLEMPGLHTAGAVITLGLLVSLCWQAPKLKALICSIIAILLVIMLELLYYNLFEILFTANIDQIIQSKLYWFLGSWLHIITLTFTALLIMKTQWYQKGLQEYTPFNNIGAR